MNIRRAMGNIRALLTSKIVMPPGITIGRNVHFGLGVILDQSHGHLITIGSDVVIAPGARILVHDSARARINGRTWVSPVRIGDRAFVGAEALIMPGVTIGEDALVAAGSVVISDVEAGTIVAGVPARVIGDVDEFDRKRTESTARAFDRKIYNRWPLDAAKLAELDAAAEEGGYFFE